MAIDVETLKSERDRLKADLREIEHEQRGLEAKIKTVRQKEIQAKREIEALNVLLDIQESKADDGKNGS